MNSNDLQIELDRTLDAFRALRYAASAEPKYGILQDTIFWGDEIPEEAQFDAMHFLTHIFRFRMEAAREKWQITDPTWEYFKQRVPDWPGFRSERCDGSSLLAAYQRMRTKTRRDGSRS